jgi:predicted nuclease of predicted toxin-antitoxin system
MRFLVDECTGPAVARWLRQYGHEVFSVYEQARGADDDFILHKAFTEDWVLITNDKDFGDKVFRERSHHHGIIVLRLQDERATIKIDCLERLLKEYADRLHDHFVVVTEKQIRFARISHG